MDNFKIGLFIKSLRESKKVSQEELANSLYVTRSLVSKWERGVVVLTSQNLKALSEYFNVSCDEILLGEYKSKDNKKALNNLTISMYDKNMKVRKKLKIAIFIIFIILFLFFLSFFILFYNSIHLYSISNIDNLNITNSIIFKAKDKIYLNINPHITDTSVKKIALYYEINNEKKIIYTSSNLNNIIINDYYDKEKYFDFKKFNEIKDNLYILLIYDNKEEAYKLNLDNEYSNTKIFLNIMSINNYIYKQSSIKDNVRFLDSLIEEFSNKEDIVSYNNIDYKVKIGEDNIEISNDKEVYKYNKDTSYLEKDNTKEIIFIYDINKEEEIVNNTKNDIVTEVYLVIEILENVC